MSDIANQGIWDERKIYRELLTALAVAGVKRPRICEVVYGYRDKRKIDALRAFHLGRSNKASIPRDLYQKLPDLWKETNSQSVHDIIETLKSDDKTPSYANQLRRTYDIEIDELAKAGNFWKGRYVGYRHDPTTSSMFKSTLDVEQYDPIEKGIAYRHWRHETTSYVIKGLLIPAKSTYCFFGRSYVEQKDGADKHHHGVVTILIDRPTRDDRAIWERQRLRFLQGLIMVALPDDRSHAFASRVVFVKEEEHLKGQPILDLWDKERSMAQAIAEIDGAMAEPDAHPDGSIARPLLSNEIRAPENCLSSYKIPIP